MARARGQELHKAPPCQGIVRSHVGSVKIARRLASRPFHAVSPFPRYAIRCLIRDAFLGPKGDPFPTFFQAADCTLFTTTSPQFVSSPLLSKGPRPIPIQIQSPLSAVMHLTTWRSWRLTGRDRLSGVAKCDDDGAAKAGEGRRQRALLKSRISVVHRRLSNVFTCEP